MISTALVKFTCFSWINNVCQICSDILTLLIEKPQWSPRYPRSWVWVCLYDSILCYLCLRRYLGVTEHVCFCENVHNYRSLLIRNCVLICTKICGWMSQKCNYFFPYATTCLNLITLYSYVQTALLTSNNCLRYPHAALYNVCGYFYTCVYTCEVYVCTGQLRIYISIFLYQYAGT